MNFEVAFWIGLGGALIALAFAFFQSRKVMSFSEGTEAMQKIASLIRRGANAYLKRQFKTVAVFYVIAVVLLGVLAYLGFASMFIPFAFLAGGAFAQLSAFLGMKIATYANVRTANAANESLNKGLSVALSSGAVLSFTIVGLSLFDVSVWFLLLRFVFGLGGSEIAENMVMFGAGVAVFAVFARLGGGIFTKAADVGADLVGKVEVGIPEDDPRNPAVIADNVGDNVGDVAGMGADLFESYIKAMHGSMALGWAAFGETGLGWAAMFLPVALFVAGMFASIIGMFLIKTDEKASQKQLLKSFRTGTYGAAIIATITAAPLVYFIMDGRMGLFISILVGVAAGCLISYFTEYYTSANYKPTQMLAASSGTGPATMIIGGIALGMKSLVPPFLIVSTALIGSFLAAGGTLDTSAANYNLLFRQGLYGIGLSAVGMLSTLGITLATDAYGPVADNAGGIAQMADLGPAVRERTDALDSLGNTTAATGKGFAIGSAALTSLALLVSYVNIARDRLAYFRPGYELELSIINPSVLVGIFIGVMVVFAFSAFSMAAVQRSAQSIVMEVRRQLREITGILEGTAEPDYERCIDLCTKSALREMVAPTVMTILTPIITGLILGVKGVVGVIGGATVAGFALAVFMSNAGGAWDNAKKYIESGEHGGKGSDNHKTAVIGDTIGDPFKDTAGPSLNTLFKMLSTVSIIFVGVVAAFSLF